MVCISVQAPVSGASSCAGHSSRRASPHTEYPQCPTVPAAKTPSRPGAPSHHDLPIGQAAASLKKVAIPEAPESSRMGGEGRGGGGRKKKKGGKEGREEKRTLGSVWE